MVGNLYTFKCGTQCEEKATPCYLQVYDELEPPPLPRYCPWSGKCNWHHIQLVECDRCDGVGWYEGGKTLQTQCNKCSGRGYVEKVMP